MINNIVPEFKVLDFVSKAVEFIRVDYEYWKEQNNLDKSYLRTILGGNSIQRYNLIKQAEEVFINRGIDDERYLEVNMMFNMAKEGAPTIHITLPSEQTQTGGNGLGIDEGYQDNIIVDSVYNNEELVTQGSITPVFTRRYTSAYNIVITGDNSNEVILIYRVLNCLLTSLTPQLSLEGLQNIVLGGQDVQLYRDVVPKNFYMRALTMKLEFETSVPSIFSSPIFKNLFVTGNPVENY
jgi:hypothetical protein